MRIAVDVGHSTVKAWSAGNRHVVFPARIVTAPVTMDLGQLSSGGDAAFAIAEDGGSSTAYWVGDRAVMLAAPLWSRDKAADPLTRALVYAALARMETGDGPVGLGLGLPLAWFRDGQEPLRAAFLGRRVTVAHNGRVHRWTVAAVRVFPQGASAALAAFRRGSMQDPGLYVVVDVGYRTTEHVVVQVREGRLSGRAEWSGMLDAGWSQVDEDAARRLSEERGVTVRAASLTGHETVLYGHTVDLAPYRRPGLDALAARISQAVQANLGDEWTQLRGALVIGGAAEPVAARLGWSPLPVQVPSQPVFANAQGYWDGVESMVVPPVSVVRP